MKERFSLTKSILDEQNERWLRMFNEVQKEKKKHMNKKYEYKGNIYCEEDLSKEIYNYGGDLDDLFFELLRNKDIEETTYYHAKDACSSDECYEDYKELIKEEYEKLGIEVLQGYE